MADSPSGASAVTPGNVTPGNVNATPGRRTPPRWLAPAALLALLVVGGVFRFVNLGALTYQVDEGYQLAGVTGILEHGVPKLDSGHAYTRAPLFLYTEAACAKVLGLSPFSMRLPAAFFGLLCIPVGLWFGRRLVNPATGWALATMIALSQWHVELSRYARFYTLLALVVMLALLAFHAGYMQRKFWPKVWFWVLALVAVTLHDTAVSLGMCFLVLLPVRDRTWWYRAGLVVQAGLVGVMWVGYRKVLKAWDVAISDPNLELVYKQPDVAEESAEASSALSFIPGLKLPDFANTVDAFGHGLWAMAIPAVVALVGWVFIGLSTRRPGRCKACVIAGLIVLCALFHQGAIALLLAVVGLAMFVRTRRELRGPIGVGMLAGALILGFHAAVNVKFLKYGYANGVTQLFAYPDWHRYALQWLGRGWMPILIVLPVGLVMLAWRGRDAEGRPAGPWLIVGFLLLGLSLGGLAEGKFNEARYFFHLWALILSAYALVWVTLGAWVADRLNLAAAGPGRAAVIAVLVAGGIAVSEDLRPTTAWGVTQRDYPDTRDHVRGVFNWRAFADFHEDVQSVSVYVKENMREGDRVMSVGPPHRGTLVNHFVGKLDYIVARPMVFTLKREDEFGRWHEPVTDAEIVDTPERLIELLDELDEQGVRLWVVSNDRMTQVRPDMLVDEEFAALLDRVTPSHAVRGRDGSSFAGVAGVAGVPGGVESVE